ncbi:hypothetical protein EV421DRAFT_1935196 [Armillaria borealis]|uniref:Uncharacterized protein n=1 Tax=Armillaria borealis TaxID=47425 RepID=A0AA39JR11_9AGAR|nr:hypothetical protein EV421DRAFT_1935196 [Armillaria borealis]
MTTPLAFPVTSDEMHRIFTIPELVTSIITEFVSHGTRGSLVRGPLTVCKLWADISMDLIWYQIDDPSAIFRLLAPVEDRSVDGDVLYDWDCSFKALPMPSGWARFDLYRHRVRVLEDATYTNHHSVMSDIAVLGLDSTVFLPNLTDLSWLYIQGEVWRDSVFMHEGIETFTLMLELRDPGISELILQYFEHIAARMPRLQSFTLHLGSHHEAYQGHLKPALSWLLPKLHFLKVLELTPMLDSDLYDVTSSTASLPNIENIDARINKYMSRSLVIASPPTSPITLSCKLRSLSLENSYFGAAAYLLSESTEFPVMTKLSLQSYKPESRKSTRTLTRTISLISDAFVLTANEHDLPPDGRITLTDIQSLFHCRNVVRFSIYYACPLQLTNDDIKNILQNWDTLKEPFLNPSPTYLLPSDVSHPYPGDWETLAVIAEYSGHLEGLGLYLNGFAEVPPRASMQSLPKLMRLKVGTSKLPSKMKDAARFLSQLLTLQCRVHCSFMSQTMQDGMTYPDYYSLLFGQGWKNRS